MEKIKLEAEIRDQVGKDAVKRLRSSGLIPAVVYKAGDMAVNLKISSRALHKVLHTEAGENVIINLTLGEKNKTVIIKEIQYHPVRGDILHIDFNQISLKEQLTVDVPVETKGESQGVNAGGVLEHILWELKVECLPAQIPEKIEADITDLKIGDSIHVKDLDVPQDVKVLTDAEAIVVSVKPPVVEKAEEEALEEGATEPEVITEKKKEETEESKPPEGKEK